MKKIIYLISFLSVILLVTSAFVSATSPSDRSRYGNSNFKNTFEENIRNSKSSYEAPSEPVPSQESENEGLLRSGIGEVDRDGPVADSLLVFVFTSIAYGIYLRWMQKRRTNTIK